MENPTITLADESKPREADINVKKESKNTSMVTPSVALEEIGKENGVKISGNGKQGLDDGVVTVVKTAVVETEIEVKDGGDNETVEKLGSALGGETEIEVKDGGGDEAEEIGSKEFSDKEIISVLVDIGMNRDGIFGKRKGDPVDKKGESQGEKIKDMSDMKDGEEEEEGFGDGEYEFSVGDFVWGKIKSHPWWPGRIYDPSDASDHALKLKQRNNRLLVAYFDGTFAWCHSSQLKPFAENFEGISKRSSSKNFVNALQNALDEIGLLLELKMICSCVPKESLVGLEKPFTDNFGIKQGVLVPECGIAKLWDNLIGSSDCLTQLKHTAKVVCMKNLLELTQLKHCLSAFYRAKGGYKLAVFHEAQPIAGLEDVEKMSRDKNVLEVAAKGPVEEDWLSSPSRKTNQFMLQGCTGVSENGQHQRRKQKSIAEILEGDIDADKAMSSGKMKRKVNEEASGGSNLASKPKRRRVAKLLESTPVTQSEATDSEEDDSETKEKESMRKKKKSSKTENGDNDVSPASGDNKSGQGDDSEAKNHDEKGYLSRERKKSKYLSPPYTNVSGKLSKKELEAESIKAANEAHEAQVAVRMTKAASILIGSGESPNVKLSGLQKEVSKVSDASSPRTPKPDDNKMIDATKVKAPVSEVVSMIRSVAIEQNFLNENDSVDMVEGFISEYRSSVFSDGSNYELYNNITHPGRKRKTSDSGMLTKNQNDQKSKRAKTKKGEEPKSEKPKDKQAAMTHAVKTKGDEKKTRDKKQKHVAKVQEKRKEKGKDGKSVQNVESDAEETEGKNSSELFVSFGPGSSLPSKDEIIKVYGKFGALNKEETDMFYNNYCARVVFLRSSDAEVAFESSRIASPFGSSNCTYQLRHSSSSKMKEVKGTFSSPKAKEVKGTSKTAAKNKPSPLKLITQKLETVTAMVENSDGKIAPDLKSELEGELQDISEKVRTLVGSSS